jgi:threonine/homoserine/homoserine lactone efflux protein
VASAIAYSTVKLAGAVYLLYLGVQALRASRRPTADAGPVGLAVPGRAFLAGVVSTVLNPKPALFFLTFLPQFVDPARGSVATQILVLGAILGTLGFAADCLYALAASSAARRVGGWRHGRTLTGAVYLALGTTAAAFGGRAH